MRVKKNMVGFERGCGLERWGMGVGSGGISRGGGKEELMYEIGEMIESVV